MDRTRGDVADNGRADTRTRVSACAIAAAILVSLGAALTSAVEVARLRKELRTEHAERISRMERTLEGVNAEAATERARNALRLAAAEYELELAWLVVCSETGEKVAADGCGRAERIRIADGLGCAALRAGRNVGEGPDSESAESAWKAALERGWCEESAYGAAAGPERRSGAGSEETTGTAARNPW